MIRRSQIAHNNKSVRPYLEIGRNLLGGPFKIDDRCGCYGLYPGDIIRYELFDKYYLVLGVDSEPNHQTDLAMLEVSITFKDRSSRPSFVINNITLTNPDDITWMFIEEYYVDIATEVLPESDGHCVEYITQRRFTTLRQYGYKCLEEMRQVPMKTIMDSLRHEMNVYHNEEE